MRRLLRTISFALRALFCMPLSVRSGSRRLPPAALEALQAAAPDGFAIYQKIKDKTFFLHWISCNDGSLASRRRCMNPCTTSPGRSMRFR